MIRGVVIALAALLACRPQPANQTVDSARSTADTVRGVLVIEGSDPFPLTTLKTAAGRVIIDAPDLKLANLARLDLWLRGTRTDSGRFRAEDFRVRAANGVPAWDGVLRSGPSGLQLELDDGSLHQVRGAPSTFARLAGTRIWLTENADGTLREYGVI